MGLWNDIRIDTGYDSIEDLEERDRIRRAYIQKAVDKGLDATKASEALERYNAYDKEASGKENIRGREAQQKSTFGQAEAAKAAEQGFMPAGKLGTESQEVTRPEEEIGQPEQGPYLEAKPSLALSELEKSRQIEKPNPNQYTPQELKQKLSEEQSQWPEVLKPFQVGIEESPVGQFGSKFGLTPDLKKAFNEQMNQRRAEYEAGLAKKSLPARIVSRTAEAIGSMEGSPSTYIAAPAGGALQGVKFAGALAMPAFGAAQGAESGLSEQALDREANVVERAGVGAVTGYLGGKFGSVMGRGAGNVVESAVAKTGARELAGKAGTASGIAGEALGQGVGGSLTQMGMDIKEGRTEGMVQRAIEGIGSQTMLGIPRMAMAERIATRGMRKNTEGVNIPIDDEYVRALSEYSESTAPKPEKGVDQAVMEQIKATKPARTNKTRIDVDPFAPSEAAMKDKGTFSDAMKAVGWKVGEGVVDSNLRALWKLDKLVPFERDAIVKHYESTGMKREEILDRMNKGEIALPLAERMHNLIEALPTVNQRSIRKANKIMSDAYKGLSVSESELLNKYMVARNNLNIKDRMPDYRMPKGMTRENLQKFVADVESDPRWMSEGRNTIVDKANDVFMINRVLLDDMHKTGHISDDSYNRMVAIGDNIGIEHFLDHEPRRFFGDKYSQKGYGPDTPEYLGQGAKLPANLDVGSITHKRIVERFMARAVNESIEPLFEMAKRGQFGRVVEPGTKPAPGNDIIEYRMRGEVPAEGQATLFPEEPQMSQQIVHIEVPDWFKASMERTPIKSNITRLIALATGSATTRAFAVGINPEFALSNVVRDFSRYYRMLSSGDPIVRATPENIMKKFVSENPIKYAITMGRAIKRVAVDVARKNGIWEEAFQNNALRGRWTKDIENDPYANPDSSLGAALNKAGAAYRGVQEVLGAPGAYSEDLLRVAAYSMLREKGFTPQRAGELTGQFLDYNRTGSITRVLDAISPFFNVAIRAPMADLRMAKKYPVSYGIRLSYGLAAFTAAAAAKYAWGTAYDEQTDDQRTNNLNFELGRDAQGRMKFFSLPLDQQDRLPASIADSIVRAKFGIPVDWVRIARAARDYALINNITGLVEPGVFRAYGAVANDVNKDFYRNQKLYFGPEPSPGARYAAYDKFKDSKSAIFLSDFLHTITGGKIDVQPAMVDYAVAQYIPNSMLERVMASGIEKVTPDVEGYGAEVPDNKSSRIPFVSRFIRTGDMNRPYRQAAAEPMAERSEDVLGDWRKRNEAARIKDISEYQKFMTGWASSEKDPRKIIKIYREMIKGTKDRAMGVDTRFQNFMQNQVDPAAYEDVSRKYEQTHGVNPLNTNPKLLKKMYMERAFNNDDTDEQ